MKLHLPKLPKINLPLARILWGILAVVIVLELLVLYRFVFLGFTQIKTETRPIPATVRIDLESFEEAQEWIEENSGYILEPYSLVSPDRGRENPFAEYR